MIPTPQQQGVIDSTDPDILVEAGAGSGKTSTMVARYIRLLRGGQEGEEPLEPREILAFTFTDKAAGELREKVREARRELPVEAAAETGSLGQQEISMSEAWVGTFHAICLRILKAYPIEAEVDPGFSVIDDVVAETTRSDAFSEALELFRNEDPDPGSRDEMVGAYTERGVRETVLTAWNQLRSRGIESPRLPEFKGTDYPADGIGRLQAEAADLAGSGLHATPKRKVVAVQDYLEQAGEGGVTLDGLAPLAFDSEAKGIGEFPEILKLTVADLAAIEIGDRIRGYFDRLIQLFGECYNARKAGQSVLDYEDLQLIALRLLRKNAGIRKAYRDRFREIMVDEFQDTNRLQLSLIEELRGEATTLITVGDEMQSIYGFRHADVELFRARRNDPEVTVLKLTDNFRSRFPVIDAVNEIGCRLDGQVEEKRRPGVGTGVEEGRGPRESSDRHLFTRLTGGRTDTDQPASATLMLTGWNGWKELDLGELAPAVPATEKVGKEVDHFNEAEALALARHLREMVDLGEARQGEIAILLRARTRADLYVSALRQVGLTPYLVGGSGFWKTRESIEVRALLSVVANPLDDESLLAVLTSPACGLSTDALWLLKKAGPKYRPLWPTLRSLGGKDLPDDAEKTWLKELPGEELERARAFVARIGDLRDSLATTPLGELVEKAVTMTGYDLANLMRDRSRNGLANVRRLGSLAHEYELSQGRDLRGFLDWAGLSEKLDSEAPVATREEESDVVRIMTVHAAKGLEFKVTCVPDCGRRNTSRQDTSLILGRSPEPPDLLDFKLGMKLRTINRGEFKLYEWETLAEQARLANEDEELRLFHVALTRAEDQLVVSGVLPEKLPDGISEALPMITRVSSALRLDPENPDLWPESEPTRDDRENERPGAGIRVVPNLASEERAIELREESSPLEWERATRTGTPPLDRPPLAIMPSIPLSFSALDQFRECPTRFYASRVLKLGNDDRSGIAGPGDEGGRIVQDTRIISPGETGPEEESLNLRDHGTRFGSAVHEVLEALGNSRWPEVKEDRVERALKKQGLDPAEDLGKGIDMIRGFTSSKLGARVLGGDARFEVPLLMSLGNLTIRGFIDVLVESDPPLIIDYKTSILAEKSPAEKMLDYVEQRNLYSLAVARSRGLNRVESAFVFLEMPDEPVVETIDRTGLDAAESALEESLADFTRARFFGGEDAGSQPCGECWACDMLAARRARTA